MSPPPSVHELARLPRTMTWKWQASTCVMAEPRPTSWGILAIPTSEVILRAFARALARKSLLRSTEVTFGVRFTFDARTASQESP